MSVPPKRARCGSGSGGAVAAAAPAVADPRAAWLLETDAVAVSAVFGDAVPDLEAAARKVNDALLHAKARRAATSSKIEDIVRESKPHKISTNVDIDRNSSSRSICAYFLVGPNSIPWWIDLDNENVEGEDRPRVEAEGGCLFLEDGYWQFGPEFAEGLLGSSGIEAFESEGILVEFDAAAPADVRKNVALKFLAALGTHVAGLFGYTDEHGIGLGWDAGSMREALVNPQPAPWDSDSD